MAEDRIVLWFHGSRDAVSPEIEAPDRAARAAVAAVTAGLGFAEAAQEARNAAGRKGHTHADDNSGYAERLERMHTGLAPVFSLDSEAASANHAGRLHFPTQGVLLVRPLVSAWVFWLALVIVGLAIIVDAHGTPLGTVFGACLLLLSILPAYLGRAHLADLRTRAVDSISGDLRKETETDAEGDRAYYLNVMGRRFRVKRNVFESVEAGRATTIFFSRRGGTFVNLDVYDRPQL
jgi:hypothetical protein